MIKNFILLGFLILIAASCATKTKHRIVYREPAIKPRKLSHLDCVKDLLKMDVEAERANEVCTAIFRKEYK